MSGERVSFSTDVSLELGKSFLSGSEGQKTPQPDSKADFTDKLGDEFWQDFGRDLTSVLSAAEKLTFGQFLRCFNPEDPFSLKTPWSKGKYQKTYYSLFTSFTKDSQTQAAFSMYNNRLDREKAEVFYDQAPLKIKLLLSTGFPQDFKPVATEELVKEDLLPLHLKPILETAGSFSPDRRERILRSAATYAQSRSLDSALPCTQNALCVKEEVDCVKREANCPNVPSVMGIQGLSLEIIQKAFAQIASPKENKPVPTLDLENLLQIAQNFAPVLEQTASDNTLLAKTAGELISSVEEAYFKPLFKSVLYKPASLFWNMHQQKRGGELAAPASLVNFLETHLVNKLESLEISEQARDYLERVLPKVYRDFSDLAVFATNIRFFKEKDQKGLPTTLFLHQVEAVKYLTEQKGGILADEPGTGKTVELALASLNLAAQKNPTLENPARILVVGSKSVINNWEQELDIHIDTSELDILNVNFAKDEKESVAKRLRAVKTHLEAPTNATQILLLNYDMFRQSRLQKILTEYNFDVKIVDEAHNVKSRFLESLDEEALHPLRVARRTYNLYSYLKRDKDAAVFLATSTPFVKEMIEPLIMAHLVDPSAMPVNLLRDLAGDSVATNQALRKVMLRRRKEEIADLPPKETLFYPLDLTLLPKDDQEAFDSLASGLAARSENGFAHFYSRLSLEAQVKYPWLLEKVKSLLEEGKKVVIFSPFVAAEKTYTSAISTQAIAGKLKEAGIESVAVLDGSLDDESRLLAQKDFRRAGGVKVLVGNYLTAGESITLNSAENSATEVILFVCPNAVSRYIQAIDRIHRFGQEQKVTIHIPFVTGDLQKEGTYDERVVRRLFEEMSVFNEVVDGLFFVESSDLYQKIAQEEKANNIKGKLDFRAYDKSKTRKTRNEEILISDEDLRDDLQEEKMDSSFDLWKLAEEYQDFNVLVERIKHYPVFSPEQEKIVFKALRGQMSLSYVRQNPEFLASIKPADQSKFALLFQDSEDLDAFIINGNLRLVAWFAYRYKERGLPFEDLFQEGTFGLMRAKDDFDPGKGVKFSTYADAWIKQAIRRALEQKGDLIRLPVYMHENLVKARRIYNQLTETKSYPPSARELETVLQKSTDFTDQAIDFLLREIYLPKPVSLDETLPGSATTYAEMLEDPNVDTERLVLDAVNSTKLQEEIDRALNTLPKRQRLIIESRYGVKSEGGKTLEEVGREVGLSRERIRQIEEEAIKNLRHSPSLRRYWRSGRNAFGRGQNQPENSILEDTLQIKAKSEVVFERQNSEEQNYLP